MPAGIRRALRQRGNAAARGLSGARQAGLVRPDHSARVRRQRRFGDRPRHSARGSGTAFRRTRDVAVPHADLRRLRGDHARHEGTKRKDSAEGAERRAVVLLRPDRAEFGFGCRRPEHPRNRRGRRLRDQRPEGIHLGHGHQRLLPAGDAHHATGKAAAGHHQFSRRHQAAGHRGAQDQDARPARDRHHAGVLQRRQGAGERGAGRSRQGLGGGRFLPVVRAPVPVGGAHRGGQRGVRDSRSIMRRRASSSGGRSASSRRSRTSSPT